MSSWNVICVEILKEAVSDYADVAMNCETVFFPSKYTHKDSNSNNQTEVGHMDVLLHISLKF